MKVRELGPDDLQQWAPMYLCFHFTGVSVLMDSLCRTLAGDRVPMG